MIWSCVSVCGFAFHDKPVAPVSPLNDTGIRLLGVSVTVRTSVAQLPLDL